METALVARRDDPPASHYEEQLDTPAPRGVHVVHDKQGRVIDAWLDPSEFDGPDGYPEGWSYAADTTARRAWHAVLGYLLVGALLLAFCLGSLAGLVYVLYLIVS